MFKFLSTLIVLLAASPAIAEGNTLCDDGGPLTCILDSSKEYTCGTMEGLVALQGGCLLCVNPTTCLGIGPAIQMNAAQDYTRPLPKANGNDISVLLQDQADHNPEEPALDQAAATANAKLDEIATPVEVKRPQEISNWLFSIPVCLAIVSLGLAIRSRVPPHRRGFQRLQDKNRQDTNSLFQEDINPFCSNDMEEDFTTETPGHFQGDRSNNESEETQFLPSAELEEDEFSQAESEAIKQAVLLHIKEFDAEDEEVDI